MQKFTISKRKILSLQWEFPPCCRDPLHTPLGRLVYSEEHFYLFGHVCVLLQQKADRAFHQSDWINLSIKYWCMTSKWNLSLVYQSFIPPYLQSHPLLRPINAEADSGTLALISLWQSIQKYFLACSSTYFLCLVVQQQTCTLLLIIMFEILSWPTALKKNFRSLWLQ